MAAQSLRKGARISVFLTAVVSVAGKKAAVRALMAQPSFAFRTVAGSVAAFRTVRRVHKGRPINAKLTAAAEDVRKKVVRNLLKARASARPMVAGNAVLLSVAPNLLVGNHTLVVASRMEGRF